MEEQLQLSARRIYPNVTDFYEKGPVHRCIHAISCSAKIPIYALFTAAFFPEHPVLVIIPSAKSVLMLMWDKAKDFLQRAFTIIFIAALIIWFLQTFDSRFNVVADSKDSLLAMLGKCIAPIFIPLGFNDWRVATSLISGFSAKEAVVSTLSVLMIATIKREMNSAWKAFLVVLMQCAVAWAVSFAVYNVLRLIIG